MYEGDLNDEDTLRKWAMDQETLAIAGQIEEISGPMLDYFYENNDQFVVLFYEEDDRDADDIIEGLEGNVFTLWYRPCLGTSKGLHLFSIPGYCYRYKLTS